MSIALGIGRLPLGNKTLVEQAISILRRPGLTSQIYLPGIGAISGLTAGNYLLADGSTGATPVDGLQGLVLDAAGSLGSELVTNGDFRSGTGWAATGGWSVAGGVAVGSSVTAFNELGQATASLVTGNAYLCTFDVVSYTSGNCRINLYNGTQVAGPYVSAVGTYSCYLVANANTAFGVQAGGSGFTGSVDNISVKQVTGIHATAAGAARPTLRRDVTSGRYSSQFSGAQSLTLGSVPFQMSDDHCVVMSVMSNSFATLLQPWYNGGSTGVSRCASMYITGTVGNPTFFWRDDSSVSTTLNLPVIPLGEYGVVSCRKVGTNVIARKNGGSQQSGSVAALGATTVNYAAIGSLQGASNNHNGPLGPVILIKGAITEAELLTLERFASSLTPNGPIF